MPGGAVVTVGNFDGVHLGHASLVTRARDLAGPDGTVIARVFDPHPLTRLRPAVAPPPLTTFEDRVEALRRLGVDAVIRLEPTDELLGRSPDEFIEMMVRDHQPTVFVEGPDFRFGHDRAGDLDVLRRLGERHGFTVHVVEPVEAELCDQTLAPVSSSLIRWLVARGRVMDATRMLGRRYEVTATVESGDQRGRTIGVPTANFRPAVLWPARGVYACEATDANGRWHPAAVNIGRKPTFGASAPVCEAHLIRFDGPVDQYGWTIRVRFHAFLRDEMKFPGVESIKSQLKRDIERTTMYIEQIGGRAA